jgi:hypothetical protein
MIANICGQLLERGCSMDSKLRIPDIKPKQRQMKMKYARILEHFLTCTSEHLALFRFRETENFMPDTVHVTLFSSFQT